MAKKGTRRPRNEGAPRSRPLKSNSAEPSMNGVILPLGELDPHVGMRTVMLQNYPGVPDDTYGVVDAYCADPSCDCRVAYLFIVSQRHPGPQLASITVGWEPLSFYQKWMGSSKGDDTARELKGPSLMAMTPQSPLAPAFLEIMSAKLQDPEYLDFFRARYYQFKSLLPHQPRG